jgi:hypothetical protein
MPLDDFDGLPIPQPTGLVVLQKIALGFEVGLLVLAGIGMFFKLMSFPYADEVIVFSLISLSMIYLVLPILLFNSKKGAEHLLAHFFGLFLCVAFISVVFKIMNWPLGYDVASTGLYFSIPIGLVLAFLTIIYLKKPEKRKFYLLMGLRFVLVLILIY